MKQVHFSKDATFKELYAPAMLIENQEEANIYFDALVKYMQDTCGQSEEEATTIQKTNLGYYAGYYDHETRVRVERLFGCAHPIFGKASKEQITPERAFELGVEFGKNKKGEPNETTKPTD